MDTLFTNRCINRDNNHSNLEGSRYFLFGGIKTKRLFITYDQENKIWLSGR